MEGPLPTPLWLLYFKHSLSPSPFVYEWNFWTLLGNNDGIEASTDVDTGLTPTLFSSRDFFYQSMIPYFDFWLYQVDGSVRESCHDFGLSCMRWSSRGWLPPFVNKASTIQGQIATLSYDYFESGLMQTKRVLKDKGGRRNWLRVS